MKITFRLYLENGNRWKKSARELLKKFQFPSNFNCSHVFVNISVFDKIANSSKYAVTQAAVRQNHFKANGQGSKKNFKWE